MKISKLTARQGNVDVEGTIKEIGDVKTFNKFGRELRVADAVLEDSSGSIRLSLWNDDADRFKVGDKVKIVNGYVNEFQGEKQLTAGKFGKMEKIGEGEESEKPEEIEESEESKEIEGELEDSDKEKEKKVEEAGEFKEESEEQIEEPESEETEEEF